MAPTSPSGDKLAKFGRVSFRIGNQAKQADIAPQQALLHYPALHCVARSEAQRAMQQQETSLASKFHSKEGHTLNISVLWGETLDT